MEVHLRNLDKKKPVIWTGDLNVAPTEKGLAVTSVFPTWLIFILRPQERKEELEQGCWLH